MANQAVKDLVNKAVDMAKENEIATLKELDTKSLEEMVNSEIINIITPLEEEIKNTKSWWVKIRNRMYITAIKSSVGSIVTGLKSKIQTL